RDGSLDALTALARTSLDVLGELAAAGSLGPARTARLSEELAERLRRNPVVRVPRHVVLLARTLVLLSGLARSLRSRVGPLALVFPYAVRAPLPTALVSQRGRAVGGQPPARGRPPGGPRDARGWTEACALAA